MPSAERKSPSQNTVEGGHESRLTGRLPIAAVAAVCLVLFTLLLPFLEPGYRNGHDMSAHVTYTYLFDEAIRQGQFPVRWIEGPASGYSQPLFNFYQVGLYYLVEVVHVVVPRLSLSLTLTVGLLWWTGAGFMFLWLKRFGSLPAALGALMFALSPYLVQDIFVRAAYPEFAAICFAPGVMWSVDRLMTTGRPVFLPISASLLGLMIICHLPAALIVSPLLVANVLFLCVTNQAKWASVRKVAVAGVWALGLSAFYVLPALVELKYVNVRALNTGDADYHNHFVMAKQLDGLGLGRPDQLSFQLGVSQWIVVGLGSLFILWALAQRRRLPPREFGILVWLGAIGLALFMTNASSLRIWETLRFLSFIQFPWRFFLLISIAAAALGAFLLASIHDARVQAVILLVAIGLHLPLYINYQRPERLFPRDGLNIDDPAWRQTDQARRLAFYQMGYDPAGITQKPPVQIERSTIAEGSGTVRTIHERDDALTVEAQTGAGMRLSINSHYFPGWDIRRDGRDVTPAVMPGYGFILVDVPAGLHRIDARFGNTPVRTYANTMTLISAAWLVLSSAARLRSWPRRRARRAFSA
jgi:hypothetical protein